MLEDRSDSSDMSDHSCDSSDMSESISEIDKYGGNDYRYKYSEKCIYSGYSKVCCMEKVRYINIEDYRISDDYREVEMGVPFKGELYNLYVDVERARYEEDINIYLMKNGKKTNLSVSTKERQMVISYNNIDCILCEEGDKIVLGFDGKQKKDRIMKWAFSYKKI